MKNLCKAKLNTIKYCICIFLLTITFISWFSYANDLLQLIIEPAYYFETILWLWINIDTVWKSIPQIIVNITKFLLILVISLSITMILYNGMVYIIQTWQWKNAKSLTKNIIYIIVWIFVALFSIVIITLIQSIPYTLWNTKELPTNTYEHDQKAISFKNLLL